MLISRRSLLPARALTFGIALVLVAACGTSGQSGTGRDGYMIADRIVAADVAAGGTAAADIAAPPSLANTDGSVDPIGSDCELEVTTDEYGFEVTKLVCADEEFEPTQTAASTLTRSDPSATARGVAAAALMASDDPLPLDTYGVVIADHMVPGSLEPALGRTLLSLTPHLDQLDATCGVDLAGWEAALGAYREAAQSVLDVVTPEALGDFRASVEATVVARALAERVLFQSGCRDPEPRLLVPDGTTDLDGLIGLTSDVTTVTVALNNVLRGSNYGPLFHTFSTLPNFLWMRAERTPVEMVMLGTSQVGAALNVKAMNESLDTEIASAWIPGALAEVQALWVDEVTSRTDVTTFVWFVGPLDLFADCDTSTQGVEFKRLAEARAATFSRGYVVSADPLDRILGPAEPADTVRGDGIKRDGLDADGMAAHREQYVPAFEKNLFCHERAALIQGTVGRLAGQGYDVIVVGMPVHPELRAVRPDQAEMMALFQQRYLGFTPFLDLTDTMVAPELWSDFTHLTGQGADAFTVIVIEQLRERGW